MHKCLPRNANAIQRAVFAVVRCPSVCHVDVSKQPNLTFHRLEEALEKVQKRATKTVPHLKHLKYSEHCTTDA